MKSTDLMGSINRNDKRGRLEWKASVRRFGRSSDNLVGSRRAWRLISHDRIKSRGSGNADLSSIEKCSIKCVYAKRFIAGEGGVYERQWDEYIEVPRAGNTAPHLGSQG